MKGSLEVIEEWIRFYEERRNDLKDEESVLKLIRAEKEQVLGAIVALKAARSEIKNCEELNNV